MFKNALLASVAAFVVFGSAASLTNMKAVITSGNGADAALTRDAFNLADQLNEVRAEQTRQAALLSVQEIVMERLRRDIAQGGKSLSPDVPDATGTMTIGLDTPSPARERKAADYHRAWLQAITLETELVDAQARYDELAASSDARVAAFETQTAERIAKLEQDTRFEISRLEEEIQQRDSSIVGLMHRLVSLQGGSAAPTPTSAPMTAPVSAPMPAAAPAKDARANDSMPTESTTASSMSAPAETVAEMAEPKAKVETAIVSAVASVATGTIADGVAAYKAGDYRRAFDIWRPLANAGNARAWFHLGALYYEGRGVARELETAELLLGKAVNAGHPHAVALHSKVVSEMNAEQVATAPVVATR